MADMSQLVWIEDAAREYNRSRSWLQKLVDSGQLARVMVPGDRRLYLRREELQELMRPQVRREGDE